MHQASGRVTQWATPLYPAVIAARTQPVAVPHNVYTAEQETMNPQLALGTRARNIYRLLTIILNT